MTHTESLLIGQKAIEEWDREWKLVAGGLKAYQPKLRRIVGLFRVRRGSQIMFIGQATELKGGLAKRLSDHHRPGNSGRNYRAGRLIYRYRHELVVEVLIVGAGSQAQSDTRDLKPRMLQRHKPPWNVRRAVARAKPKGVAKRVQLKPSAKRSGRCRREAR